jgi:uncharacterized membrane protein (DUF485 family)
MQIYIQLILHSIKQLLLYFSFISVFTFNLPLLLETIILENISLGLYF